MSRDGARKPERFDFQAESFDARTGLPTGAGEAIARAVLSLSESNPSGLLVELGAGTGEIGQHLARSVRYVAIDRSERMLAIFHEKLTAVGNRDAQLMNIDGDEPWPIDEGTVSSVFASRSAHLLDPGHLVAEVLRVCRPGGHFLVGRVVRDEAGLKNRMRRERRCLLGALGIWAKDGYRSTDRVLDDLVTSGALRVQAWAVTEWTASGSAKEILDGWRVVGVPDGAHMSAAAQLEVLTELEKWAARELGDLESVSTWKEQYVLEGVKLSTNGC